MTAENEELFKQFEEQAKLTKQLEQQISMIEGIAKKFMEKKAIARYGTVKIAHPETAVKAITIIAQAASTGQLQKKIDDAQFKELLQQIKEKKEFKIKK